MPWVGGGNLPWDDPAFSERMLREHLDESHAAASRLSAERLIQIKWLQSKLDVTAGAQLLDVTCGPGLYAIDFAGRDCLVTGIDFSPASITYARELARQRDVADKCTFVQQDVRHMNLKKTTFEAAILLYGQLAVFTIAEARLILERIAQSLKPGGKLAVELLDQDKVDKRHSTWWFTDDRGLWGESPFLHLGERFWLEEEAMSIERFYTIHLDGGALDEILLCDQTYSVDSMTRMMRDAGFRSVDVYPAWDGLPLYDADEWIVYLAEV